MATGTLSELVLCANIVQAHHTIFLPLKSTDTFSVFIAWLPWFYLDGYLEVPSHGSALPGWNLSWIHTMLPTKQNIVIGLDCCLSFVLLFFMHALVDPSKLLLVILLGAGIIQLWALVSGAVYKHWCLDALEGSSWQLIVDSFLIYISPGWSSYWLCMPC